MERWALAERYVARLAGDGVVRGLIGPREVPRLWDRHILNCAVLAELVPVGASVVDLGSGAGLPGLVLALVRPDLRVTLVEPLLRRTTFLQEVVDDLELSQVRVVRARAEALHGGEGFDVVTSRAVAPLPRLLAWSMPLVLPGGVLLAMKGSTAAAEVEESRTVWSAWGCRRPEVVEAGAGVVSPPTQVVRVAWKDPSAISWPPVAPRSAGATAERRPTARGGGGSARSGRAGPPSPRQQRSQRDQ